MIGFSFAEGMAFAVFALTTGRRRYRGLLRNAASSNSPDWIEEPIRLEWRLTRPYDPCAAALRLLDVGASTSSGNNPERQVWTPVRLVVNGRVIQIMN